MMMASKKKIDMTKFKKLSQFNGRSIRADVIVRNRIGLVWARGKWWGLNYRSTCPTHLRNRMERQTWADIVGATGREVENYCRRQAVIENKERAKRDIEHAQAILARYGVKTP